MAQKKHKPGEIVTKLRQVDVLVSQGRPAAEATLAVLSIGDTGNCIREGAQKRHGTITLCLQGAAPVNVDQHAGETQGPSVFSEIDTAVCLNPTINTVFLGSPVGGDNPSSLRDLAVGLGKAIFLRRLAGRTQGRRLAFWAGVPGAAAAPGRPADCFSL